MWALLVVVAAAVLLAVTAHRHGRYHGDSVAREQQRLEALRDAVGATTAMPQHGVGAAPFEPFQPRRGPALARVVTGGALLLLLLGVVGTVAEMLGDDGGDSAAERARPGRSPTTDSGAPVTSTTTSTTSTTRPVAAVTAVAGDRITVSVPAGRYVVTLTARDRCWLRAERDGAPVEEAIVNAGDRRDFTSEGAFTLRLGNPAAVMVAVDGEALGFPVAGGTPMDLDFVPAR
jgi:hypothetical protein